MYTKYLHTKYKNWSSNGYWQYLSRTGKIYPNPAKDKIYIELASNAAITHLQLFNSIGTKQISTAGNQSTKGLDIAHLPNGLYLLQITMKNGTVIHKKIEILK